MKRLQVDNGFSGGERSLKARSSGIARSKRFPGSGEQQLLPRPPQVLPATPEAESHLGLKSCSEGIRRRILDNSVGTSGDFFFRRFFQAQPKNITRVDVVDRADEGDGVDKVDRGDGGDGSD